MGITGSKAAVLTGEEKQLLRSSWEQVMKNKTAFSVDVFVRVFKASKDAHQAFDQLKGISPEELRDNPMMKAHCLRVNSILNTMVAETDNAVLGELIRNIARTHYRYGNFVQKPHYEVFAKSFMYALENELKGKLDGKTKNAWIKAIGAMQECILANQKQLESGA